MPDDITPPPTGGDGGQTTPPPSTNYLSQILDPGTPGKFVEKWQERLPAELDEYKPMLAQIGDFPTLAKVLKDNKEAARQKAGVRKLTPDAPPEAVKAFRQEFGIPDAPYEYKKPEQLPEGVEWRDDRVKNFGEWAHKNNLTPEQAQAGLDLYLGFVAEDAKTWKTTEEQMRTQHRAKELEELTNKFGGRLDTVVSNAQRAALMRGLEPDMVNPDSPKYLGNGMLSLLNDYALAVGESRLPTAAGVINMTPEREYQSIIKDKSNPKHELWAKGDKETKAYVDELRRRAVAAQGGTLVQK